MLLLITGCVALAADTLAAFLIHPGDFAAAATEPAAENAGQTIHA